MFDLTLSFPFPQIDLISKRDCGKLYNQRLSEATERSALYVRVGKSDSSVSQRPV